MFNCSLFRISYCQGQKSLKATDQGKPSCWFTCFIGCLPASPTLFGPSSFSHHAWCPWYSKEVFPYFIWQMSTHLLRGNSNVFSIDSCSTSRQEATLPVPSFHQPYYNKTLYHTVIICCYTCFSKASKRQNSEQTHYLTCTKCSINECKMYE